ncbi:MAG: hypothetical protein DYG89_38020 [Caldilinea sp. CFX5]|nr:hypothetical protein [Caldilinea sp. CFX5]
MYNGEDKWTAPNNLADLIEDEPALGKYRLNFEHFVIAENRFGKEALLAIRNIVSTLFLAEVHYDLPLLVEQLFILFLEEDDKQALSLFLNWFRQLAARGYIPQNDFAQIEEQYRTKEEVTSMLIKALEREREVIRQQATETRNREIVRAMAEKGLALTLIAEVTQLSLAEIERLLTEEPTPSR